MSKLIILADSCEYPRDEFPDDFLATVQPQPMPMTTPAPPAHEESPKPPLQASSAKWRKRLATVWQTLALLAGVILFLSVVHSHYPIQRWLFWHYLWIWLLSGLWAAGCASVGCFLLSRFRLAACRDTADLVVAFPVGVLSFELAIFLLGLAGFLNSAIFALLPLVFLASGAGRLREALRGFGRSAPVRTLPELAVIAFGIVGVGLIYFQILSPAPFSWDARWYHLPIARQYALQGAVRAFPEGWWLSAYPHGASLVYTWAFLLPVGPLFDKLELCAHLDMAVFLATIASIPALVRALLPGASGRLTWAAIFLFPGIFLYDANLNVGADHMAGLWCIPLFLALLRVWRTWALRDGVLFGALAAAVVLSKYSAWAVVVFPAFLFLVRAAWLGWRRFRGADRPVLGTLLACTVTGLLLSAPHWLKNWIWYGDPVYPIAYRWFKVHPWSADSPANYRVFVSFTFPPAPGWQGVKDALLSTLTFSFKPNDWWAFHHDVPVFGSLFTLTMVCVPFVRAKPRLWLAYLGIMVTMVAWYLTNHQDRFLQAWLPIMAGATCATLILLWRGGNFVVRTLVAILVAAQIVWGGDVPFFPTHNITGDSALRINSNFLASGFLKTPHRLRPYGALGEIGETLPRDAHLLLHGLDLQVGLDVQVVNDQWQGRISYATLKSPSAIYRELSSLGVTHMIWDSESTSDMNSLASDLAFAEFALNFGDNAFSIDNYTVARLPAQAPPLGLNDKVAMLTCRGPYRAGWYLLGDLTVPEPGQPWASPRAPVGDLQGATESAGFMVVDPDCHPDLPQAANDLFRRPFSRESHKLYVRKLAR